MPGSKLQHCTWPCSSGGDNTFSCCQWLSRVASAAVIQRLQVLELNLVCVCVCLLKALNGAWLKHWLHSMCCGAQHCTVYCTWQCSGPRNCLSCQPLAALPSAEIGICLVLWCFRPAWFWLICMIQTHCVWYTVRSANSPRAVSLDHAD